MPRTLLLGGILVILVGSALSFTIARSGLVLTPQRTRTHPCLMGMSEFERDIPNKLTQIEPKATDQSTNGDSADVEDAVTPAVLKSVKEPEISDTMKARLRKEIRSQGGDPNYSAGPVLGNPILIVSIIVAVLVVIGGKGFFF